MEYRNIVSEEQYNGDDFRFGLKRSAPHEGPVIWNPDSRDSMNPHMLFCGLSGAGKSTLLKNLTRYLDRRGKDIYLIDPQGDLELDGEKHIEFTAWNSQYALNLFKFGYGVKKHELEQLITDYKNGKDIPPELSSVIQNSGPFVQVLEMIEIIKNDFMQNMGQNQEPILKRLFSDTYKMKGIIHDNFTTWLNELPTLKDTKVLIEQIESAFESLQSGVDKDALKTIKKISKELDRAKDEEIFNNFKTDDYGDAAAEVFEVCTDTLKDYMIKRASGKTVKDKNKFFDSHNIDVEYYMRKDVIRVIQKLSFYVDTLIESGVFHGNTPEFTGGLTRINISGLRYDVQRFIANVILGDVFRECKVRGEYVKLKDKSKGDRCDTFIIIDETKLVVPPGKEKNNPFSYLNRIATEARKYGLGLIVVAQTSVHFPEEFLRNFYMQVILTTNRSDYDNTRKNFGIVKDLLEMTKDFGLALVKTRVGFVPVMLPWYKSNSFVANMTAEIKVKIEFLEELLETLKKGLYASAIEKIKKLIAKD
ncbi:MAG: hypothetical protein PHE67_00510 [Campylobacterales bacterium]|nr:hypothetical protein [Campylobacterales bacterium]